MQFDLFHCGSKQCFHRTTEADVNETKRRLLKLGINARSLTNHIYHVFPMDLAFYMLSLPKGAHSPAMVKMIYFFIS